MQLTEFYCNNMRGMNQIPKSSRLKAMLGALDRKESIYMHNRYIFDAVQILNSDTWEKKPDWHFIDIKNLANIDEKDAESALIEQLNNKLKEAKEETFESFEAFQVENNQRIENLSDFLDWYYYNLPYVELGLEDEKKPWKKAMPRIEWFMSRYQDELSAEMSYQLKNYALYHLFISPELS